LVIYIFPFGKEYLPWFFSNIMVVIIIIIISTGKTLKIDLGQDDQFWAR